MKHKETQNPARELICVEVGDLNELASSWKELYMFSPLPIIKGIIANPNFKLKCRKKVIFLANNKNKPTPFCFPRVAFTVGD